MYKDPNQSLFIGQEQVILPSCHSTNQVAADLMAEGKAKDGLLVITNDQTAGKGQRGNSWESQPFQNLTFSLVLKPKFLPIQHQFDLTVITSLALVQSLEKLGLSEVSIKWPNDIFLDSRKLAGILIENTLRADLLESTIIGIGLNVNQSKFKTPAATSMRLETGQLFILDEVLAVLLSEFQHLYQELQSETSQHLRQRYLRYLHWMGQEHMFINNRTKTPFKGSIQGIDEYGKLQIAKDNGIVTFDFKEVAFLE